MTTFRVEDIWEEDSDLSESEDTGNKTVGKIQLIEIGFFTILNYLKLEKLSIHYILLVNIFLLTKNN